MPTPEEYVKIMRGDALDCLRNLALLDAMQNATNNLGVSGSHPSAKLYNCIARNAQIVALVSLARLFDTGTDAISLRKARKNRTLRQPSNARALWKEIDKNVITNLRVWRNNLLAHSLTRQVEEHIPKAFPFTPAEIQEVLRVCVELINQYSELNRTGNALYQISWDCEFETAAELVPNMVRGILGNG